MSELVYDCPRCGAGNMTADLNGISRIADSGWQHNYEAFCTCRKCKRSSILVLRGKNVPAQQYVAQRGVAQISGAVNDFLDIRGFISIKDVSQVQPPPDVPDEIGRIFNEGATCLAVECFNAAGTMFRLCIDMATQARLPIDPLHPPSHKVRRSLGLRMQWLFEQGVLPLSLRELSTCVKEDGNDGAHEGTLEKADAEDLLDFTHELLHRLYSDAAKLSRATLRRHARRA